MTISVWGDDERAMWAEANEDARQQAEYEALYCDRCPNEAQPKHYDAPACWDCMTSAERIALVGGYPILRLVVPS